MPVMLRPRGKGKKIAYRLIGVPSSFSGKVDKRTDKMLTNQDTWRMK